MRCKGRGDIGVRFDKLNELRDGKVSEFVERSKIVLSVIPLAKILPSPTDN